MFRMDKIVYPVDSVLIVSRDYLRRKMFNNLITKLYFMKNID